MTSEQKIDEILKIVRTERELNNFRFVQVSHSIQTLKQEMSDLKRELKGDINKVFVSLSEDIQAFSGDLNKVKKRVNQSEGKPN